MCRAKALVLPSSKEVFSYASLEAMACGTPPVVSSAVPEDIIIHKYNGLRVDSLNPIDYAEALKNVLKDENLWLNLSENVLRYIKKFDYVEVAKSYAELLKRFINQIADTMVRSLKPAEALNYVRRVVGSSGDQRVQHSFYLEYGRRLFTLEVVYEFCPPGSMLLDLGASPFIVSCALAYMGYNIVAVDCNPEEYSAIASALGIRAVKADLERDQLNLPSESVDCVIFTEVLERLNPYYVSKVLVEINRVLKPGGKLILTTPNIASLFRRIKLLLGKQPQYVTHVHEYTKKEVEELLEKHSFRVLKSWYSEVNDLTYVDAEPGEYLKLESYRDLLRLAMKNLQR